MSTLNSLRERGTLDEAGARQLYSTVLQIARSRNFPPPSGYATWDVSSAQEVAHDFLTGTNALQRLLKLALLADDDESFQRLLSRAVLNYLRSEARRSTVGRQIRRIRDICGADESFRVQNSGQTYIGLAEMSESPYSGADDPLIRAVSSIAMSQIRWRPDSSREGPIATHEDLVHLMQTLIRAAGGPVSIEQIGRVLSRRFNLSRLPDADLSDVLDPAADRRNSELELGDEARKILDQLTDRERIVLPLLDMSSRAAAAELGLGHSTVALVQSRLRDLLSRTLPDTDEGAAIIRLLTEHLARHA